MCNISGFNEKNREKNETINFFVTLQFILYDLVNRYFYKRQG
jgi:hypothetical protein